MTASCEFKSVSRRGARASSAHFVIHVRRTSSPPSRVGFVVSKAVGNAVRRNRVKRRLRHLVVPLLLDEPNVLVVVRAKPGVDLVASEALRREFERTWQRAVQRITPQPSQEAR